MSDCSLHIENGVVRVWIDGRGKVMEVLKEDLKKGAVFGLREDGISAVRIWAEGNKLFVLNVFSKNVAWPQDVFEFPFDSAGWVTAIKTTELHIYLSQGSGIPALTAK